VPSGSDFPFQSEQYEVVPVADCMIDRLPYVGHFTNPLTLQQG